MGPAGLALVVGIVVVVIVVVGPIFDFVNGFHDASNAIATSVSTRALTPRIAILMSAVLNLVGALVSTRVAPTIGNGIIFSPTGVHGLGRVGKAGHLVQTSAAARVSPAK